VIEFGKEAAQLLRASTLVSFCLKGRNFFRPSLIASYLNSKAIISGQTTIKSVLSELIQKYKVQVDALVQQALQVILNGISMVGFIFVFF
jgi:hypothetical protein